MIQLPQAKVIQDGKSEKARQRCEGWNACIAEVQRLNATAQPVSDAGNDVLAERHRQQTVEGWKTKHDDQYQFNELAIAGALYALNAHDSSPAHFKSPPSHWPWNAEWWKPKSPRKDLVRAAALIIAEIERIDRLAAAPGGQDDKG
ncbi:hypothetical protein [Pantoea ananatis]|uniref:hypothetical protein n=1 Tax=Pantoea ananas TaxID=553 RepID=UPI000313E280|nr:hypothetical protein [Pantoea ananatis]